ncbi:MAG: replicative DNA helicase [Acidobacteria bacterium]|nr:replicative DNA helicase [Acidobacteriota bacterium]
MTAEWLPERLPEDVDAERSLLATCCSPGMEGTAAEIVLLLEDDDFAHPGHRALFRALRGLLEHRLEVNALTLKDALDQEGELQRVGGFAGLTEMLSAEEVGRPQVLADLLKRKSHHRALIRLGSRLARQAAEEAEGPDTLIENAAQDLFRRAQGDRRKRGLEHVAHVAQESMERLLARLDGQGAPGLRVGFSRLDALTQGFQPGNLVVLAARPGIGKTALALNWLLRSAVHHRAFGGLFSLEMSSEEVFNRLLSAQARVNMKAVQAGYFDAKVEDRLKEARNELVQLPIFVNDQASLTVRDIQAMVDRHLSHANQRLDLVIVDYLQLMSSPEGSRGAKQSEAVRIGEISRGLKLLAKDRQVPIVVLSQLNREVEHRQGGRPQLSDLRDSGAIEQDADIVMFIHRRMVPVQEGQEPDRTAELIVAKHRNGPTGIIPLYFEGEYATYRELERDTG